MHYKFKLENLKTGDVGYFRTLKELSIFIDVPYHQTRSVLLSNDKQYLHPKIKELSDHFIITKLDYFNN